MTSRRLISEQPTPSRAASRVVLGMLLVSSAVQRMTCSSSMVALVTGHGHPVSSASGLSLIWGVRLLALVELASGIGLLSGVLVPVILRLLIAESMIIIICGALLYEPILCWLGFGAAVPLRWKPDLLAPLAMSLVMALVLLLHPRMKNGLSRTWPVMIFSISAMLTACAGTQPQELSIMVTTMGNQITLLPAETLWRAPSPDADAILSIASPHAQSTIHSGITGSPILDKEGQLCYVAGAFLGDTEQGIIQALDPKPLTSWFHAQVSLLRSTDSQGTATAARAFRLGQTVGLSHWWGSYNSGCAVGVVCALDSDFALVMMKDLWQFPSESLTAPCSFAVLNAPLIGLGRDPAGPSAIYAPSSLIGSATILNHNLVVVSAVVPPAVRLTMSIHDASVLIFSGSWMVCSDELHWRLWVEDCIKSATAQVIISPTSVLKATILINGARLTEITMHGSIGAGWRNPLLDIMHEVIADQSLPDSIEIRVE
jgi:hypothetical protein